MPQVIIGLVQPVFPRRVEDVQINRVFHRPGFMRHVRWNAEHFPCSHHNLFAVDRKFQRAFQNVSDLLIVMMMQGHVGAFLHEHACQHDLLADHHFPVNQRIQWLVLDVLPRNVFHFRCSAHCLAPYSFAALSCRYMCASSSAFSSLKAPSETSSASAAAMAVRAERDASQKVSSAPTASLNGNASEPNIILSGKREIHCFKMFFSSEG